jgi:aristolochene synthase
MTLDEGRAYNEMVLSFMDGAKKPNRDIPVEWITYDIWQDMRECDLVLSAEVLKTMGPFMTAQTDSIRMNENVGMKAYLEWRILDIGGPYVFHASVPGEF